MSETGNMGRLVDSERTSVEQTMKATQEQLRSLAQTLKAKLGDEGGAPDIKTVTYGVKVLIVRTADGGCYVYDGNRGVCRVCDGVSDGET